MGVCHCSRFQLECEDDVFAILPSLIWYAYNTLINFCKHYHLQARRHIHLWPTSHQYWISNLYHNNPLLPSLVASILNTIIYSTFQNNILLSQEQANGHFPDLTQISFVWFTPNKLLGSIALVR